MCIFVAEIVPKSKKSRYSQPILKTQSRFRKQGQITIKSTYREKKEHNKFQ